MASSPYRFTIQTDRPEEGTPRSRVGLSSITTGGGGSAGGEGYRASALRPGSSGFMAATFGGAPRTDYVKPTTTATVTAPNPTPEAPAAALAPEYLGDSGMGGEGGGAGSGQTGGPTGFDNGGQPGDLSNVVGDISIDGKTVGGLLGGLAGGLALGPLGALGGALAGRAIGSSFDGGAQSSGGGIGGDPANAQSGASENSAANSGASQAGNMMGDGTFAEGGWVGRPYKGNAMHGKKKGLAGFGGGKDEGYMGAYAGGGRVPNYADGGPVDGAGLAGPNPPGPDDGFAALDGGEFVVRQSQAQRPDYASVLEQINQGTYEPAEGDEGTMGGSTTEGIMPAEGGGNGADPASLPPMMQQALGQAVAADPMLAQALTSLLGPEAVHELMECCGGGGMGMGEDMAKGGHETPFGRPPLAGPKPPPGINAPPGVRPPPAANPTMQMPPPMMGGLRGVMA